MSEMAKKARADNKAKAKRISSGDPHAKVDASDWTPPEALNTEAKTGLRPVSRRAFNTGGAAKKNVGRKPRKSGGNVADEIVNRNVKDANEGKFGKTHVGGMKRGGRKGRAEGGKCDGVEQGTRPTGGRCARKEGGRTKGKTNINIIISTGPKGGQAMPPGGPMPPPPPPPKPMAAPPAPMGGGTPPGAPPPMPPGGMMPRKSGGRANPRTTGYMQMEAGSGSALGRLQKAHGKKP